MKKFILMLLFMVLSSGVMAFDNFPLHINDTLPYYRGVVYDSAGPYNLINCTVKVYIKDLSGTLIVNGVSAVITNAVKGEFEYRWASSDTQIAGTYTINFRIITQSGAYFTLPTDSSYKVIITQ
jgi:hypothetical protein